MGAATRERFPEEVEASPEEVDPSWALKDTYLSSRRVLPYGEVHQARRILGSLEGPMCRCGGSVCCSLNSILPLLLYQELQVTQPLGNR